MEADKIAKSLVEIKQELHDLRFEVRGVTRRLSQAQGLIWLFLALLLLPYIIALKP